MDKTTTPVIVEFTECNAGWIYFTVKAGFQEVRIRASEVFDPFPALTAWLESIAIGVQECAFDMEEEGPEKRFEYQKVTYDRFRFRITDNYEETLLEDFVDRKQLVASFYNGIREFSKSAKYNKPEWEDELLWERMSKIATPPVDREVVLNCLLAKSRKALIELFFKFAPVVLISYPDAKDDNESFAKSIDYMCSPDDPEKTKGIVETPQYWPIPEDFDSWCIEEKTKYLYECLDENVNGAKCGTRLENIHSEIIDKFLNAKHPD